MITINVVETFFLQILKKEGQGLRFILLIIGTLKKYTGTGLLGKRSLLSSTNY
jgi:hypothetical protein